MRDRTYELVAIVAWPAFVWCVIESGLRLASGYFAGFTTMVLTGGCAAATIVTVRWRRAQLAPIPVHRPADGRD